VSFYVVCHGLMLLVKEWIGQGSDVRGGQVGQVCNLTVWAFSEGQGQE